MKRLCLITGIALGILCTSGWARSESNAVKVTRADFQKIWPMHSTNRWNVELGVVLNQEFALETKFGNGGIVLTLHNRAWQDLSYVWDYGLKRSVFELAVKDEQGAVVPFTAYGTNLFVPVYPEGLRHGPGRLLSGGGFPGPRAFQFAPGQVLREAYALSDIVALKPGRYSLTACATISGRDGKAKLTVPDVPFVVKPLDSAKPAKPPEESSAPQPPDH